MENASENVAGGEVVTGMTEASLSALMDRFEADGRVAGGRPIQRAAADTVPGGEWDKLTLLTGGFVPVGSIFWARPPKLKNQQRIMLTLNKARQVMRPFYPEEADDAEIGQKEGFMEALFEQGTMMAKLAADLFYVYECEHPQADVVEFVRGGALSLTKADFRPATEEEVTDDETGLTAHEIFVVMNRLMAIATESSGNA